MSKEIKSGTNIIEGFKDFKSYVDQLDSDILNELTGNLSKTKDKLFNIAENKKQNNNNNTVTETESTPENNNNNNNSNFDFKAGGFRPDLTNLGSYNPNVNIAANLEKGNFYTNLEGDASLKGGVNYDAEAGYKGDKFDARIDPGGIHAGTKINDKVDINLDTRFNGGNTNIGANYAGDNVDARIDTRGFEIGKTFGDDDANVNVNLAQNFDGNTDVNVEGKKQLNKYLDLTGFAGTDGNYGASLGFDFKF